MRISWCVALVLLSACATHQASEAQNAHGLVVVSLQGASLQRATALLQTGRMPTLETLARRGTGVIPVVPADAPATAVARATFETGADPASHGIVANAFHNRGDSIRMGRSGFNTPYRTETLYQAAARQGLRVATVGISSAPASVADSRIAAVTAGRVLRASRVITLAGDESSDTALLVLAGDSIRFIVRLTNGTITATVRQSSGSETHTALSRAEWTSLWMTHVTPRVGARLKVLEGATGPVRVYVSAVVQTDAQPVALATAMEQRLGPAPGTPDWAGYASGQVDDETWREQVHREADYLTTAVEHIRSTLRPELVMLAMNLLDAFEHQYLRTDRRHPVFGRASPAQQAEWRSWIEGAYMKADSLVARVVLGARNVIVASEYALLAVHSRYQLAAALRDLGYRVQGDTADVRVFASSASAHIRLNVRGREPAGVVGDSVAAVARLTRELRELRDPSTGAPVLARIESSATMNARGDRSPMVGDVRVIAHPGFALGDASAATDMIDVPFLPGEHAFDPGLPDTHGLFVAAGREVSRPPAASVHAVDVAVTAARLLGIAPPRGATGRAITGRADARR